MLKEIPNAYLYLVGDGPDKKYFEELAKKENVQNRVKIPGFVINKYDYYALFDIFAFPSIWPLEGFGLVAIEAMSQKLPVVGPGNGPVTEIIEDGKTGYVVSVTNQKALANTIVKLGKNESLRKKLGEEGYRRAIANYDIKKISDKYLGVFYGNL